MNSKNSLNFSAEVSILWLLEKIKTETFTFKSIQGYLPRKQTRAQSLDILLAIRELVCFSFVLRFSALSRMVVILRLAIFLC